MKKLLFVAALALGTLTVSAADYTHSIGGMVGNMYGVSYKGFIFGVDGLALQADLGVKLSNFGKSASYSFDGKTSDISDVPDGVKVYSQDYFTFEVNPNIVYQRPIASFGFGSLDWFAGGGISLGMMKYGNSGNNYFDDKGNKKNFWWAMSAKVDDGDGKEDCLPLSGKFGFNAIGGVELNLNAVPLAIALDFRPGYGLGFGREENANGDKKGWSLSFFDWTLAASVRYCF